MNTSLYFLDNLGACSSFLSKEHQSDISHENFDTIGVGFYSFELFDKKEKLGFTLNASPSFIKKEISDKVITGVLSPIANESILFQIQSPYHQFIPITKWLFFGINPAPIEVEIFNPDLHLHMGQIKNVKTSEDFLIAFFDYTFSKIIQIKAKRVVLFIDSYLIYNYTQYIRKWLATQMTQQQNAQRNFSENEKEVIHEFIKELIIYISELYQFQEIALVFGSSDCYRSALSIAHSLRNQSLVHDSLVFKLN